LTKKCLSRPKTTTLIEVAFGRKKDTVEGVSEQGTQFEGPRASLKKSSPRTNSYTKKIK
jgi:hypothetical protein